MPTQIRKLNDITVIPMKIITNASKNIQKRGVILPKFFLKLRKSRPGITVFTCTIRRIRRSN
jgi:hypothetical protein